jgi:hypothetical protein
MYINRALAALCLIGLVGCAVSERAPEKSVQPTGFLNDYSQLKPGAKDQALLVYFNPNAQWNTYDSVLIEPVSMWSAPEHKISANDAQMLTAYYGNALRENLSKNFKVVDQPGPGVMTVRVALTDPTSATPVLRSIAVIIPQARLLSAVKNLATGSYAFVGTAQSEGEIVDSMTGVRLAAAVDRLQGGTSIKNANVWEWGDAEKAMDLWAKRTDDRLVALQNGT